MNTRIVAIASLYGLAWLSGCGSVEPASRAVVYKDINSAGQIASVGIESQDIAGVTDRMVRDILANSDLAQRATVPRVLMDPDYFRNDSSQPINKALITERLRVNLQKASQRKVQFIPRATAGAAVAKERELKRDGVTDTGTTGLMRAQVGIDYLLTGRISSQEKRSKSNGAVERYTQITFDLVDAESGVSVWADIYEFSKEGLDDAVYR